MCEDPGYYYEQQDNKVAVLPTQEVIIDLKPKAEHEQAAQPEIVNPLQ